MEARRVECSGVLLAWVATCGNDEQRMMYRNAVEHNRHCVAEYDTFNYAIRTRLSN